MLLLRGTGLDGGERPSAACNISRVGGIKERMNDTTVAFESLYRAHVSRVYALALRLTGDPRDATEVTQDAFVRVWEGLASFRGDSAISTWLHRIVINEALQARRSSERRDARVSSCDAATLELHAARPEHAAERIDLEAAIRSLPLGARHVFVLHDIEGYNHREIAEMTGRAEGSVRAQLSRARDLLRGMLR